MKILTWNINGIRATKVQLKTLLDSLDADIICIQETKVTRDQLDEPSAIVEGYNSYFSFSKARSGYSGVATFVKDSATPVKVEEGLTGILSNLVQSDKIGCYGNQEEFSDEELQSLDNEGRGIITQHKLKKCNGDEGLLSIINVYCPRADPEREERKAYKLRFYELLQLRAEALLRAGSHVVVLGDVNTAHRPIDQGDAEVDKEFSKHKGRQWLNGFLFDPDHPPDPSADLNTSTASDGTTKGHKFIDTFRLFYPDLTNAYSCWSTVTGARATNYGTRIDYIFADVELAEKGCTDCVIRPDIEGSDHCPVKANFKWEAIPAAKCPPLCTKYLPEFAGKQQKLSAFFGKTLKKSFSDSDAISSQDSNPEVSIKPPIKRTGSELTKPSMKKQKSADSNRSGGSKQGSLLSFFGKKPTAAESSVKSVDGKTGAGGDINVVSQLKDSSSNAVSQVKDSSSISSQVKGSPSSSKSGSQSASWKSLLKGPAPPPLCKGHQEPCLLRTVKKDTLNKGRQFYVCNRPEGHKGNPEARCDFFVWVEKKKK